MENSVAFERATTLERTTLATRESRERTVVVLGGSYAAIQVAHRLLKYARMYVRNLKVVMVSKNTHLYWNLASVRAIIPGLTKDDDVFANIDRGFAHYATDSFVHVIGTAVRVDPNSRTVWIDYAPRHSLDLDGNEIQPNVERHEIKYDQIILCTGTRTTDSDMPWKNLDSTDETRERLHVTQRKVEQAEKIVVGGAGTTGVEVAAELAYEYARASDDKKKEIHLVCKDNMVLGGDQLAKKVEKELVKLGVKLIKNASVKSKRTEGGKTEVTLSNNETIECDLYLSTTGLVPNAEYLPDPYKTDEGYAKVDEYFRVVEAPGMWAVGDIVSKPRASFLHTDKQAAAVAFNVEQILRNKDPAKVKSLPTDILAVSLGRKRGAGRAGKMPLPSMGVYWSKGRSLGMNRMAGYLDGSPW